MCVLCILVYTYIKQPRSHVARKRFYCPTKNFLCSTYAHHHRHRHDHHRIICKTKQCALVISLEIGIFFWPHSSTPPFICSSTHSQSSFHLHSFHIAFHVCIQILTKPNRFIHVLAEYNRQPLKHSKNSISDWLIGICTKIENSAVFVTAISKVICFGLHSLSQIRLSSPSSSSKFKNVISCEKCFVLNEIHEQLPNRTRRRLDFDQCLNIPKLRTTKRSSPRWSPTKDITEGALAFPVSTPLSTVWMYCAMNVILLLSIDIQYAVRTLCIHCVTLALDMKQNVPFQSCEFSVVHFYPDQMKLKLIYRN